MSDDSGAEFRRNFRTHLVGRRIAALTSEVLVTEEWLESCGLRKHCSTGNLPRGKPIALLAERTLKLVAAIATCIDFQVPFLIIDRSRPLGYVEDILRRLRLQCAYDTEEDSLLFAGAHGAGLQLPGAMYLVLSSGTSATRKCSVMSYRAFSALNMKVGNYFARNDVQLSHLHVINGVEFGYFFWDLLLMAFYAPSSFLYDCYDVSRNSPDKVVPGSAVSMTPTMLCNLIGRYGPNHLPHFVFLSGERISRLHIREMRRHELMATHTLFSSYALTETGGQVAMAKLTSDNLIEGVAGSLLAGVDIELEKTDEFGPGRLWIKSDTLAEGYLTQAGLSHFIHGRFLPTDDFAEWDERTGLLRIVGRALSRPKRNGVIVDLDELRQRILASVDCEEANVELVSRADADVVVATLFFRDEAGGDQHVATIPDVLYQDPEIELLIVGRVSNVSSNGKLESPFGATQRLAAQAANTEDFLRWTKTLLGWMGFPIETNLEHAGLMDIGMKSVQLATFRDALCVFFQLSFTMTDLFRCSTLSSVAELLKTSSAAAQT